MLLWCFNPVVMTRVMIFSRRRMETWGRWAKTSETESIENAHFLHFSLWWHVKSTLLFISRKEEEDHHHYHSCLTVEEVKKKRTSAVRSSDFSRDWLDRLRKIRSKWNVFHTTLFRGYSIMKSCVMRCWVGWLKRNLFLTLLMTTRLESVPIIQFRIMPFQNVILLLILPRLELKWNDCQGWCSQVYRKRRTDDDEKESMLLWIIFSFIFFR